MHINYIMKTSEISNSNLMVGKKERYELVDSPGEESPVGRIEHRFHVIREGLGEDKPEHGPCA